jgi:hypothetical protein
VTYTKAWTAFWWYEDLDELNRMYTVAEALSRDSEQVDDLDLIFSLLQLIRTVVLKMGFDEARADVPSRTATLRAGFARLDSAGHGPYTRARARTGCIGR